MASDTSASTPYTSNQDFGTALHDNCISSLNGLLKRLSIHQICKLHTLITDIQIAMPSKPTTCHSLLNLDLNKYPFNDPDKLCVPTMREFRSAEFVIVRAGFQALEKLDVETNKEWWHAATTCAGNLLDPSHRNVYLREFLPKIESDDIDGWKKICNENSF
ncbi:hypothetical protein FPCIR_11574 [Fusarium pseudocircinatum]|uniref:Uncharacterized protein n=1 Tax=Fusarium pseudocircinatum TaxID=56676 RepID=A0A8H5KR63_9HYPO|nr:hypothetical protein FPCIR_11574 [Fusarium pseudocircinatum]